MRLDDMSFTDYLMAEYDLKERQRKERMKQAEFEKYAKEHNIFYCTKELQEPCDDAVSRQAVLDYLKANVDDFPDYHEAIEKVLQIPSVRPQEQTGKWEEIVKEHKCYARDDTYTTTEYHCSECGEEPFVNEDGFYEFGNYCPNCGCRMVKPWESEVRNETDN